MNEGGVEQVATPARIFHSPDTRYVAEFLGTVDFLPVGVVDGVLTSELGLLGNDDLPPGNHYWGKSATLELMVRPDCLECLPDADGNAIIVDREFRGAFYLYSLQLASGTSIRCLMSHVVELPIGAPVSVRLRDGHRARLFADGRLVESAEVCF